MVVVLSFIYREKSAVGHCTTYRHPVAAEKVEIQGATAFAVSGLFSVLNLFFVVYFLHF